MVNIVIKVKPRKGHFTQIEWRGGEAGTQAMGMICTKATGGPERAALPAGSSPQGASSLPLPDKESLLNSRKDQIHRKAKALNVFLKPQFYHL